jgi:DNA-directed RNA polymerase specialized sigma24 family protein
MYGPQSIATVGKGIRMAMAQHLWKGRRVRVAGVLEQVAVRRPEELAEIYGEYFDLVYRRCHATLQDREAALDATQDVFVQALNSFEQVRHDIVRELLDLARTLSYERRRRPAREVPAANPCASARAEDPAEIAERHGVLDAVWSGLSPTERRYVADKFAGYSFEEIARRNRRALGTVSSNLDRAYKHARRMRQPMLPGLLGLLGWRRLHDLGRRARAAATSPYASLAAQPVQSLTLTVAIAGMLGGVGAAATLPHAPGPTAPVMAAQPSTDHDALQVAGAGPLASGGGGTPIAYSSGSNAAPRTGGSLLALPLGGSAESETPEDSTIFTVTPSPHYAQDHTLVALGTGHSCNCQVIMRSTDGGATWHTAPGPKTGTQIVLPPNYPNDSRIYVGDGNGFSAGGIYWTARWGDTFSPIAGVPAGTLAVSSGFDSGDPRLFVASTQGLLSYDTSSGIVNTLIVNPLGGAQAAVGTAWGAPQTGIFALTNSKAFSPSAPTDSATAPQGTSVWICPPGGMCHRTATIVNAVMWQLSVSRNFAVDHTLSIDSGTQFLVSRDAGRTFSAVATPAAVNGGELTVDSDGSASVVLWLVAQLRSQTWTILRSGTVGQTWSGTTSNAALASRGGALVPVSVDRTIVELPQGGLLCSVNNGASWATRCPAA